MKIGKGILISMLLVLLTVAGCQNGPSAIEQMYNHLETAVELEAEFEQHQDEMVELEQKEKDLYNEIIELGMNDIDQIQQLSSEAITILDNREELLSKEKNSIDKAKEEFDQAEEYIDQLEDENVQSLANDLVAKMNDRYAAYQNLFDFYTQSITLDRELYELLQQEDLEKDVLETKIEEINEMYEKIFETNEQFNTYTSEYNELKKEFYEQAGLDVQYSEDE
ncbi:YkyA family protein [Salirhabdus salicampi]|uniref:YkyA family protein n=1 Tax=Salirhabdus salicampi TaxID=476102 RepID=UPI0020C334AF|nr:YkyA family protein [Salirhabdus salicampi]MCP8616060.1 YkyA family protein [Salirhabdus salicampi]